MRQYFVMRQDRMEAAISEMQQLISARFPDTSYTTAIRTTRQVYN